MDKELKKLFGVIIVLVIFFILFFSSLYYYNARFDGDCLEESASNYCKEVNGTLAEVRSPEEFFCKLLEDSNPRISQFAEYKGYLFLDNERKSCLTKNKKSWRNIK